MSVVLDFRIHTVAKPKLGWYSKYKSPISFEFNGVSFRIIPFHKINASLLQTEAPPTCSPNNPKSTTQYSLTVSYLVNSCGLSLDSAMSASNLVQIQSTQKADSVRQFFRRYGFTDTQITDLITKRPQFLVSDTDKTLKPKFEFFESLGFSRPEFVELVLGNRNFLLRSLARRIIPTVYLLKRFLDTNEKLVSAIIQGSHIFSDNFHNRIEPNIETLRAHGVPDSSISRLLTLHTKTFILENEVLKETIRVVEEMGFDSHSLYFIRAMHSILRISKSKWESKLEALTSFGWSQEDFLCAFRLQPTFMMTSEEKIRTVMDFYVNKLGVEPSYLAKRPNLLSYSLEKRIVPRCSVMQVLLSKGLIDRNLTIGVFYVTKKSFEEKFVKGFQEIAPEVVSAYTGEMGYPTLETLRSMFVT